MKFFKLTAAAVLAAAVMLSCSSASDEEVFGGADDDCRLVINTGEQWLHEFDLFLWFKIDNPPQYAVWTEDLDGNYIETIAVTEKIAKEKWMANDGNRRVEALPYWVHSRGLVDSDGFMLPSSDNPMPDAVTTASATSDSVLGFNTEEGELIRIIAEFNHSTDFNSSYPEDALPGSRGYSGGKMGSGQPAVVYTAEFSPADLAYGPVELVLAGHSSPDGSDGALYPDCGSLDTALNIVESVLIMKN